MYHRGLLEWIRLPFGIASAASFYQRTPNKVLEKFIGHFMLVFIDAIVIYIKTEKEHEEHVRLVLETLETAHLMLKDSMCHWAQTKIDLLGYVVSAYGVSPQPAKTEAIRALNRPSNMTELRWFLGMTAYYCQLIANFMQLALPLCELTHDGQAVAMGRAECI